MTRIAYSYDKNKSFATFLDDYGFYHNEVIDELLTNFSYNRIDIYLTKATDDTYFAFYGQNGNQNPFMVEFKSFNEIRSVFGIKAGLNSDEDLKKIGSRNVSLIASENSIKSKLMSLRSPLGKLLTRRIKL